MTETDEERCPHRGQRMPPAVTGGHRQAAAKTQPNAPDDPLEYDHRGLPLPRRTRNGGIITPQ